MPEYRLFDLAMRMQASADGLTKREVMDEFGVSKRTVELEWTMIRAWLRRELSGEPPP